MKNRIVTAFAVAGLIGAAACQPRDEVRVEDPATMPTAEQPVVTPAPTTDPAVTDPVMTDPTVTTQPLPEDTLLLEDATAPTRDPAGTPQTPGTNP